jgi:hypothetical protein
VLALALAVLPAGCESQAQVSAEDLKAIGDAYREVLNRSGHGPDEQQFKDRLGGHSRAYRGLKEGRYELVRGLRRFELQTMEDKVLGWGKDVPDKGGPALMNDFSVRTMSAAEFKKTPKVFREYDRPPPREP